MLADMPGPMFWHLDGCNHDDKFAFDTTHKTLEEWEKERRDWEEHSRRFDAEWAERKRLGVTDSRGEGTVWSQSFTTAEGKLPLGIRVFGIGCRLAELIAGLRNYYKSASPEMQRHIDQLNRDFGNLREILQGDDLARAAALVAPVLERFAGDLNCTSNDRPDLAAKCESLTHELHRLLDHSGEDFVHDGDEDVPF
jgi:hypothetical protein